METVKFSKLSLIKLPSIGEITTPETNVENEIIDGINKIRVDIIKEVTEKIYLNKIFICHVKLEKFEIQIVLNKIINLLNMRALVVYTGKYFSTFIEKSEILKQDKSTVVRLPVDFYNKVKRLKEKKGADISKLDILCYKIFNYPICVIDIKDLTFLSNFTTIKFDVCLFLGKELVNEFETPVHELSELGKYSNRIIYSC